MRIFFRRAAAIVNFCMHEHVPMRGECPGHLMNLNFSFEQYHNILIKRFRGALRRDLIEDSFLFEAD